MNDKLILTQFESNFIHWTKHWYNGSSNENFWPQIGAIYKEQYAMDKDCYVGIYHMVRSLWLKIINVLPDHNKERFLADYENDTLPTNARFFWGAKYFADFNSGFLFNNEDIIRARITVMVSQLGSTYVKYYELLPLQEFAGLKIKKLDSAE